MFGISAAECLLIGMVTVVIIPVKEWPSVIRFGMDLRQKMHQWSTQILRELNLWDRS